MPRACEKTFSQTSYLNATGAGGRAVGGLRVEGRKEMEMRNAQERTVVSQGIAGTGTGVCCLG